MKPNIRPDIIIGQKKGRIYGVTLKKPFWYKVNYKGGGGNSITFFPCLIENLYFLLCIDCVQDTDWECPGAA